MDSVEATTQLKSEVEKLNKIIKTLEEELTNKADKIKSQDSKILEMRIESN